MSSPPPPPPPSTDYKDRRIGLIIFGVLAILFGGFLLLLVPLTFFGQTMAARQSGMEMSLGQTVTSMVQMALAAGGLIWLGIGSIMCRRWARAILLCGGWIGLAVGVIMAAMLPWLFPAMRAMMEQAGQGQTLPPAMLQIITIITVAVMMFFYIVIPGAVILFYRSRHVKLTCEARDPVERWTDRCPLPVLALVLIMAYTTFAMLMMLAQFGQAFFFFGTILYGPVAFALWLVLAGLLAWVTVGLYRIERRAWWACVGFMIFFCVNGAVTFARIDLIEFYRLSGMPEAQLKLMQNSPLMTGNLMLWTMLPSSLLLFGYLIYLRRFFFLRETPNHYRGAA